MLDAAKLKADFPVLQQTVHNNVPLVYLDSAASSQKPQAVINALSKIDSTVYANVHRGAHWLSDESTALYEESRDAVAEFINAADSREIVFTSGTTGAINLVARSWGDANIEEGDEILLTLLEHHSNIVPWQQLAERKGAIIKWCDITDDGYLNLDEFENLLSERTKIVACTMTSNVLGTYTPARQITELAHAAGAIVLLDAAQSAPHQTLDVTELDADFVAFSAHKMLGPSGIGILFGKEALLEAMPPFLGGGSMIDVVSEAGFSTAALPAKFEAGTPAISPILALPAAIAYLKQVGLENIRQHEHALVTYTHEQLNALGKINILGPPPTAKAGVVSFTVDNLHPQDLTHALDNQGVAIRAGHHCAMPLHNRLSINASGRASFYLYNTLSDVDKFIQAIDKAIQLFS
ncbi:MAG: cysteine desulfurase [Planctomycetaceae bacterium]|nr:cysteine desulfurase [Planctomycetaceae bacterium]|tara:strand:- start:1815 stop:3038 length:1224 start_codon:yes stop_codon:yes gene_type:complete